MSGTWCMLSMNDNSRRWEQIYLFSLSFAQTLPTNNCLICNAKRMYACCVLPALCSIILGCTCTICLNCDWSLQSMVCLPSVHTATVSLWIYKRFSKYYWWWHVLFISNSNVKRIDKGKCKARYVSHNSRTRHSLSLTIAACDLLKYCTRSVK